MSNSELTKHDGGAVEKRPASPEAEMLQVISRAAADPNVDVAKMSALLDLQERMMRKQAAMEYHAAMARLSPRIPRIKKNGKIAFSTAKGSQNTPYARYEDIDRELRPLLSEEGFSVSFGTEPLASGIKVSLTVSHVAGHSETSSMPLPFDTSGSKNTIQAVGSTITYGKRYLLCAAFNVIAEGEDTDGANIEAIDEKQLNTILDMQAAAEMNPQSQSKFLEYMGVKAVGDIRKCDYERGLNALRAKIRERERQRG